MSELQRLIEADFRFEEAIEVLSDLLDEKVRGRLFLAIKAAGGPNPEDMEDVHRFMEWLLVEGGDHLDAILADIHGIDLARATREREGKVREMAERIGVPPERLPVFARLHARNLAAVERSDATWGKDQNSAPPQALPRLKAVLAQTEANIAQAKAKAAAREADQAERCGHA